MVPRLRHVQQVAWLEHARQRAARRVELRQRPAHPVDDRNAVRGVVQRRHTVRGVQQPPLATVDLDVPAGSWEGRGWGRAETVSATVRQDSKAEEEGEGEEEEEEEEEEEN